MGIFVNPNNSAFQVALDSEIYVDKTQLLSYTNKVLGTKEGLICNSRPRRFGKSTTADMLTAYYSRGCDFEKMFEGLKISQDPDFRTCLNSYEVLRIDVQWCRTSAKTAAATVSYIEENVIRELQEIHPEITLPESLPDAVAAINKVTGNKFVIIIDEWDCLIREEAANIKLQEEYITLLRGHPLISMDFDGLRTSIIKMLSGDSVRVEVSAFQNDMVTFQDKDDVLTLLIHLGYLAYDETYETAFIPNEETRSEFARAARRKKWNELTELCSNRLQLDLMQAYPEVWIESD